MISILDASEQGGGAGESRVFASRVVCPFRDSIEALTACNEKAEKGPRKQVCDFRKRWCHKMPFQLWHYFVWPFLFLTHSDKCTLSQLPRIAVSIFAPSLLPDLGECILKEGLWPILNSDPPKQVDLNYVYMMFPLADDWFLHSESAVWLR